MRHFSIAISILAAAPLAAQTSRPGKTVFENQCAACHGADANGGEFAPAIITRIPTRSDTEIRNVVRDGLLNRGMPAVKMSEPELTGLVEYLRSMPQPRRGELAASPAAVELTDGRKLTGLAVNQSFEDMQLRTPDGRAHLLRREGSRYREVTSQTDWASYDGDATGNRYSNLKQIDAANAGGLKLQWMFTLAGALPLEGTPIVFQGIMYVTAANECYALDAGTGRQIWHYQRPITKELAGKVNRGAAVSEKGVFMTTDNAHVIALNRFTGELLWDTEMADHRQNYFATSAPIVAGDLVIPGIGGGDSGVRGFLAAYDAKTGKEAWRFWTIPAPGEKGSETWNGKSIQHPGGATWFTGSYDAALDTIYWQVGNPGPDHNGDDREGDNLYSDSVVALDARTGKLKWHYQFTPHDVWDWDAQEPLTLVDAEWQGRPRKLMLQANRNGFYYVLDRVSGELLLGKPFVSKLTWAKEIGANGRPVKNADQEPSEKGTKTCPALVGAANWWSTAYDPASSRYFIQAIESCGTYNKRKMEWEAGRSFTGGSFRNSPSDGPHRYLRALDAKTGKLAWELPQIGTGESRSGTLATAGGLVFFGDDSGAFRAVDSSDGKPLWSFQTSQFLRASPMTYMFDNKQLVGLESGPNILVFGLAK